MTNLCKKFDSIYKIYMNFHKTPGIITSGLAVSVTSGYWCHEISATVDPVCCNAVSNGYKVLAYCRNKVRWKKRFSNKN